MNFDPELPDTPLPITELLVNGIKVIVKGVDIECEDPRLKYEIDNGFSWFGPPRNMEFEHWRCVTNIVAEQNGVIVSGDKYMDPLDPYKLY